MCTYISTRTPWKQWVAHHWEAPGKNTSQTCQLYIFQYTSNQNKWYRKPYKRHVSCHARIRTHLSEYRTASKAPRPCDTEESSPAGLVSRTLPRIVCPSFVILPENGPSGNCLVRPKKQHEHQAGDNPGRERTSPTLGMSSGLGDHSTPITCQPGAPPEHKHSQNRTTSQGGPSFSV